MTARKFILTLLTLTLLVFVTGIVTAFAQGTAFTYQGRLNDGPNPANGSFDLTFTVYDGTGSGANVVGPILTNSALAVSNGLFTTALDFGAGVFPGSARWLEIGVRTNGGGAFTTLWPRQELTPAPYAITAENVTPGVGLAGTYSSALTLNNPANNISGSFTGDGAGLTNINTATLGGLGAGGFWQLGGNNVSGGQFLGSTNNQPVEIWVNGVRGWRLEPKVNDQNHSGIVNVVGGSPMNYAAPPVYGATISGGGAANYFGAAATNRVLQNFGTVGGG